MDEALKRAIKARGNAVLLSDDLKITPQAIYQWDKCPAERVLDVERLTGISRHELRPDIFGPPPASEAA